MRWERTAEGLDIEVETEAETDRLGRAIAAVALPGTVIGLTGPLGAGKTRLTRAVSAALGVAPDDVSSPTYTLIHEYEGRVAVYHFDAYRLGGPGPFEAIGAAEYWDVGGVCLVEWADLVAETLPASAWWVRLDHSAGEGRRVRFSAPEVGVADRLAAALAVEV